MMATGRVTSDFLGLNVTLPLVECACMLLSACLPFKLGLASVQSPNIRVVPSVLTEREPSGASCIYMKAAHLSLRPLLYTAGGMMRLKLEVSP